MKLNGWQRLWIVAMTLWALPVLFVTYWNWPTTQNVSSEDVLKQMNPADARQLADAATALPISEARQRELDQILQRMKAAGESSANIQTVVDHYKQNYAEPEIAIVDEEGVEHAFPPGFDPKRAAAIVSSQRSSLKKILRTRRTAFAGEAFASWAIAGAFVYGLGWAAAWIRRGFARPPG